MGEVGLQDDFVGYGLMAAFYGGLLFWLYRLVRAHIHTSRSLFFGYVASLAIIVACIAASLVLVMMLAGATGNLHRPSKAIVGVGVGAVLGSIVFGWQLCKSWLRRPRSAPSVG